MEKKITKGKILDIISWVLVLAIFATSLTLLITRKSKGTIAIFGNRYDVVLSGSMSYKNEEHLDFLNGHDDQIQKMDVVRSQVVDKNSDLNVYDIVLFRDTYGRTNMHRIVDKRAQSQDEINLQEATISEDRIVLANHNSAIYTNAISFTTVEVTFVSKSETFSDGYYFSFAGLAQEYDLKTNPHGDMYEHKITITKKSTAPVKFVIVHNKAFEYASEQIINFKMNAYNGEISINGKSFPEGSEQLVTNVIYEYMIRGDAAKTEDGWFNYESIYSKVNKIIPKAGYFVSYITSIPGIIMLIGLGLIIIGVDFGVDYFSKREKKKQLTDNTIEIRQENNDEEK